MHNRGKFGVVAALATTTFLTQAAAAQVRDTDGSGSWAGDIIVTATKQNGYILQEGSSATRTKTPLIQVPQSVQVINKSLITDQDRRTLTDALVNVSGVVPTKPEESAIAQPLVRGFPAEIFLDGLPAFNVNAIADPTSLTGVERIEVVKGPTSTVYGGGAGAPLGGLINVVSVRPNEKFGGYVALRGGSFATFSPFADLNLPLTSSIAFRITGEYHQQDSYIDYVHTKRWSVQPAVLFKLGEDTEILLRAKYDRRITFEYSGLPVAQAVAGQLDRDVFPGAPAGQPPSTIFNRLFTAELRHAFSENLEATVTARNYYNNYEEWGSFIYPDVQAPNPATPTVYPIFSIYLPTETKETSVDANLVWNVDALGGHHEILVGGNYDRTRYAASLSFAFTPVGSLDLANPGATMLPFNRNLSQLALSNRNFDTVAGYIQDQATYGRLHLSGSLRYSSLVLRRPQLNLDQTYKHLTPRIGATFDVVPGVALFAGYATGFRAAYDFGVNLAAGQTIKPETSRNYEVGLKFALPKAHLWGTIAAFDLLRRNVTTSDPSHLFSSIQTGAQRSRGIEADLTWEPIRALSFIANYAYTKAEVTEDNTIPVGSLLARVPKNSGRLAAHYRVLDGAAKGLSFGAGVTALSSRQTNLPNLPTAVPGYAVIDAQASYDWGKFTVTVSMANLANRHAYDTYEYLTPVVIPIQPRSAYIMVKRRF